MSGTLRNGVPLDVVEELLDLTMSIDEAANNDSRVNEAELWRSEWHVNGVDTCADAEVRECLVVMAHGWTDRARECLGRLRECVRLYYGSVK